MNCTAAVRVHCTWTLTRCTAIRLAPISPAGSHRQRRLGAWHRHRPLSRRPAALAAGLRQDLHAPGLRAFLALLRAEAHLGADAQPCEVVVQDAVPVEVELPAAVERADETI